MVFSSSPGLLKTLRTANMHSVPTLLARARSSTGLRAFWFIMWKASMTTSNSGSSTARSSILCSGSRGPVSDTARWRNLPFSFSRSSAGTISLMARS